MKKRLFCLITALMVVLAVFSGCNKNPDHTETTLNGEGGSDIVEENLTTTKKPISEEKLIALTFDDGPHKTYTNRVLDILEKNNSKATFFLVGYNIEKNVSTIKRAADMGCEIANHSQDHKNLMKLATTEEISEQVEGPNKLVKSLAGVEIKLFRAPGGNFSGVTDEIGMPLIQWSIDTEDWKYKDASNKDRSDAEREAKLNEIADRVIKNANKGDIVLMHDIYGFTADLCELIVPGLVEKGFKLVTVSEMYEAYGKELKPGEVYYSVDFAEGNTVIVEPGQYRVKTKGSVLNIRTEPSSDGSSLAKVPNGTPLTVTECISGWAMVEYNSVKGWVNTAYLEAIE